MTKIGRPPTNKLLLLALQRHKSLSPEFRSFARPLSMNSTGRQGFGRATMKLRYELLKVFLGASKIRACVATARCGITLPAARHGWAPKLACLDSTLRRAVNSRQRNRQPLE